MTDDALWTLLLRHSRNALTADDAARLRAWVDDDATRVEVLRRVEAIAAASREIEVDPDADASWTSLQQRLTPRTRAPFVATYRRPVMRDTTYAVHSAWRRYGAIAAAAVVVIGAAIAGRDAWMGRASAAPMREYRTGRGERADVVLADGSHVTLGAVSHLRARSKFGDTRDVYLEGQAFFAVAHDATHPFIVHAGDATAQDVGTAFDVRTYPGDSVVRVVVTEGRVMLRGRDTSSAAGAMLRRGDVGELRPQGTIAVSVHGANVDDYVGWMQSRLAYHGSSARDVIADVERWYDVELHIPDAALQDARVTLAIPSGATVDDVGRLLADVLGARYERAGRVITLHRIEP